MVMGFGISIVGIVLGYMLMVCVKGDYSDYDKPALNTFENWTKYEAYYRMLKLGVSVPILNRLKQWVLETFVYSSLFRLSLETSLDMLFGIMLELRYMPSGNVIETFQLLEHLPYSQLSIAISLLSMFFYMILPFYIWKKIVKRAGNVELHDKQFEERYGALYENLYLNRVGSLMYQIIFVSRRLLFAFAIIFVYFNSSYCITIFIVGSML